MKQTPLYNDFSAGELGYDLDAGVDRKRYYQGCRTLENSLPVSLGYAKRMPGTYFVGTAKGDQIPTPPPPHESCLWCYLKNDEGTGVDLVDYSPYLKDCYLTKPPAEPGDLATKFWGIPGFGRNIAGIIPPPRMWVTRDITWFDDDDVLHTIAIKAARSSMFGFIKPYLITPTTLVIGTNAMSHGGMKLGWLKLLEAGSAYWSMASQFFATVTSATAVTLNQWYCVLAHVDAVEGYGNLYVRSSGGDWVQVIHQEFVGSGVEFYSSNLKAFGYSTAGEGQITMVGGDMLWWASGVDSTCGILEPADVEELYQNLRSRYGM